MKILKTQLAAMLLVGAACAAVAGAQSSSMKSERLPGLDTAFLDTTADPCTNFFQYACGKFTQLHPIPADRSGFGSGSMLFDYNESILHSILDKAALGGANRTPNEQKIGDYYASCLDTAAINREGLKPLQPELDRIGALKSKDQLAPLLAHFQLINVNAFVGFGEQQDFADARKQIAAVDQGGLGLPERDYYLRTGAADEKIRQQYVAHIVNTLKLLGESDAKAAQDAHKVMNLETTLARNSLDITSQRDPRNVYHMTAVADLEKLAPEIGWKQFFQDSGTPPITELNVTYPPFFKALNALLESTDLDTIKTYLKWQLVNSTPGTALPAKFDEEHFDFYGKVLNGQQQQRPRWKRCVEATDGALGEALGQVYAAQAFPPSCKAATQQMVRDIESAMDSDIDTLAWMSPETRVKAREKLHAVANKIGYPDKWRDYSSLKVVRGDAMGNAIRGMEFESHRQLNKIGQPVDRGEFGMSPPTVNAYYNPSMNDINFPAGILQPPFYDPHATDAENYGHIGAVVGHELTHGFDDQGRQFDANGNLTDWWTPQDAKQFDAKTDCEVKEYGDFTVPGDVHVNGKLTLGENTADNGGLRLAYMAFLADAKRKSIDLGGKQGGYTPAQQFFIAFGQNWCGSRRPQAERMQVQTDPHSPQQFRVNGVVRNMPEFGQAFGCKQGQPMEPENACRVW
ncbi:MAG TPA: M13 family metallopeptidase [Terracidiphilus sp.]|jgi:endothelin-converting enzyme/putative endopeptidase|nr:M13 family metallopeptidase [Terracidiphilus sp.]